MNQEPRTKSKAVEFAYDLMAGGVSGIVSKTVGAPVERIKLLLQTQHINTTINVQYKGPINCMIRIYKEEGLMSFWRGNLANVYRYFPQQAMGFAFKDQYKKYFVAAKTGNAVTDRWSMIAGNFVSAGLAGGCAAFIPYPFEVARTRLAVDSLSNNLQVRQYRGTVDCLRTTYRLEGLRGVYAGAAISMFGAVVFRGLYMGGYDICKSLWDLQHRGVGVRLMAAHSVTVVVGTLCYPIDTVKRRMMIQKGNLKSNAATSTVTSTEAALGGQRAAVYRHSWDCFRRIVREEGARALFQGLSANLVRSVSGALLLVGYEEMQKMLKPISSGSSGGGSRGS